MGGSGRALTERLWWRQVPFKAGLDGGHRSVKRARALEYGPEMLSIILIGAAIGSSSSPAAAAAAAAGFEALNDTDWADARVSDDPVLPTFSNLSACVALCAARPDCVAVSWSSPATTNPADIHTCSPKCAALPGQRTHSTGHLGVIVKPGVTVCPLASWYPSTWQPDIDDGRLLLAGPKQGKCACTPHRHHKFNRCL